MSNIANDIDNRRIKLLKPIIEFIGDNQIKTSLRQWIDHNISINELIELGVIQKTVTDLLLDVSLKDFTDMTPTLISEPEIKTIPINKFGIFKIETYTEKYYYDKYGISYNQVTYCILADGTKHRTSVFKNICDVLIPSKTDPSINLTINWNKTEIPPIVFSILDQNNCS